MQHSSKQPFLLRTTFPAPFLALSLLASAQDPYVKMLELSRPNSHHATLGGIAGKWNFQDAKRSFVKGTVVRTELYDGRFYQVQVTGGRLQVPIADGKMKEDKYQEMQVEGYDNGRQQYVSTSINNHIGSDIQMQMGRYDSVSSIFTHTWENDLLRKEKVKNRRMLKIVDRSHYVEEFFEEEKGKFVKVRELDFTRVE